MSLLATSSSIVQQDLPSLILTLLDDISSEKSLIPLHSFKERIIQIYQAMNAALQKTYPNAKLLERNIEWLNEEIPKLHEELETHRSVDTLVQSKILRSLIPIPSIDLTKDNETNYQFFYKTVSPAKLTKYHQLQSTPIILELFTLISLSILSRETQDKIRKGLDLPQQIQQKVMEERIRIGTLLKDSLTQGDCSQLIQLFNDENIEANERVLIIWKEYSNLFDQLQEHREKVFESIKTGLPVLLPRLPIGKMPE